MLFTVFFIYSVGFGPVILLKRGVNYGYDYYKIILGGLLAFAWGNALVSGKRFKKPIDDTFFYRINISRKWILRLIYFISFLTSMIFLLRNWILLFSGSLGSGRIQAISGNGLILYTAQLPVIIIPMMYDIYFIGKSNRVKTISKYELILLTIVASFTLLFSGFRAPVVTMYICLFVLMIQKNHIHRSKVIVLGVIMIITVELLGNLRAILSSQSGIFLLNTFGTSLIVGCINLRYVFDTFPNKTPFQYGYTYLINLLMLLPGPDLDFTLWLKEQIGIQFAGGGVTPTILGEFYLNFGIYSIYIGMFILGILGVYIYKYFRHHSDTFLGVFYVWQFAHCCSGGIANVSITLILYTIIYWCLMLFPIQNKRGRSIHE